MPAARAVGDDHRVGARAAHGRQQRGLGHAQRDVEVLAPDSRTRRPCRSSSTRRRRRLAPARASAPRRRLGIAPNAFWWQWPWTSARAYGALPERRATSARRRARARGTPRTSAPRARAPRSRRPGSSSLSSSRRPRMHDGSSPTIGTPRATNGPSASSMRCGFGARLVDHAGREIRAAAAQRRAPSAAAATRTRVAAGREHARRRRAGSRARSRY